MNNETRHKSKLLNKGHAVSQFSSNQRFQYLSFYFHYFVSANSALCENTRFKALKINVRVEF